MTDIASNLNQVISSIKRFAKKYDRDPASISLLAAAKQQSISKIQAAYDAGQRLFGESYLQEALEKMHRLPKDIEWHFIGHIQSNKTKGIAEHFSWVHSVDSMKIARRLSEQRPDHLPPLNICIEYNLDHEASKSGIESDDALRELTAYCLSLPRITLRGLMAIPAKQTSLEAQRKEFHQLVERWEMLRQHHCVLDTLSMGMTEDLEAAIAEGSTLVRVGTAIFGKRE